MNESAITHVEAVVRQYLSTDDLPPGWSVLHVRGRRRGMLLRGRLEGGDRIVVKLWSLQRLRDRLMHRAGRGNGLREFRMYRCTERLGLRVPTAFDYGVIDGRPDFEIMIVEDLGETTGGLQYLKDCVQHRMDEEAHRFETRVIDMTRLLIAGEVLDIDQQLHNFLVRQDGEVARIDLECARPRRLTAWSARAYGQMIGRLVCSHTYACQPDHARTETFALRLAKSIAPSPRIVRHAEACIERDLARQYQNTGIDARLKLAW